MLVVDTSPAFPTRGKGSQAEEVILAATCAPEAPKLAEPSRMDSNETVGVDGSTRLVQQQAIIASKTSATHLWASKKICRGKFLRHNFSTGQACRPNLLIGSLYDSRTRRSQAPLRFLPVSR